MNALPDKLLVIAALRRELEENIERAAARAEQARVDATHAEARAENDKDMEVLRREIAASLKEPRT